MWFLARCFRHVSPFSLVRSIWTDPPVASPLVIENAGKDGRTVELGPTQPVQRTVTSDQRGSAAIADDSVILNSQRFEAHLDHDAIQLCLDESEGPKFGIFRTSEVRG